MKKNLGVIALAALLLASFIYLASKISVTDENQKAAVGVAVAGGVPALSSNPSATVKIYLDFDGHGTVASWNGYNNIPPTPAYDTDSDPTTFSTTELANIQSTWARVAEKFSPFNVDVTTIAPSTFPDGVAEHVIIGGNGDWTAPLTVNSSVQYNSFYSAAMENLVFVFSSRNTDPVSVAETVSHEAGRSFGLFNQKKYDAGGLATDNSQTPYFAPIMGNSHATRRGLWWVGSSSPMSNIQDDMSMLASRFNYKTDNAGNSIQTATPLSGSGTLSASGVIEKVSATSTPNDVDYFSFSTNGGQVTIQANNGLVTNMSFANMLDIKLQLLNSTGQQLALADISSSSPESITTTLNSGTYYVVVSGHGLMPSIDPTNKFPGWGADVGQYSLTVTLPVTQAAPAQVTGVVTTAGMYQISLSWSPVSGATSYNVYRSNTSGAETLIQSGIATTTFVNTNLAQGTYYYKIAAVNATGVGPLSSEVMDAPIIMIPPKVVLVGGVVATASGNQITVSWSPANNATSYNVYRSTTTGTETLYRTGITNTSFVDSSLPGNTTYYYKVSAINSAGEGTLSSEVSATTATAVSAPAQVTGLTARPGVGRVRLDWNPVPGATTYRVFRSTTSETETLYQAGISSTTFMNYDSTGSLFYYKVAAVNQNTPGPRSSEVSATHLTSLPAPTNVVATSPSVGTALITWSYPTNYVFSGFKIQYSTNNGTTWNALMDVGPALRSLTRNPPTGTVIRYKVLPYDGTTVYAGTQTANVTIK